MGFETFTGDGPISYWNSYVGVGQMGGQGTFIDPRIGLRIIQRPDLVTPKLLALLEYQLSLDTPEPPRGSFDRDQARRGKRLFDGRAGCASCHEGPNFTDVRSGRRRTVPFLHEPSEVGQDAGYAERSATGKYRTTPLRALWQHAPYFHDGSAADLPAVVDHYDDLFDDLNLTAGREGRPGGVPQIDLKGQNRCPRTRRNTVHVVSGAVLDGWSVLPDEQVVIHVLDGQTALFEVLMRRHNERLYRAARAILRDESEAEDVMQQAYVNAYTASSTVRRAIELSDVADSNRRPRSARACPPPGPLCHGRSRRAVERCFRRWWQPRPIPSGRRSRASSVALLESAIDRLPDGAREVFVLREVEGMSTVEVAEALDVSEAVVKTRLSRARAALRRDLCGTGSRVSPNTFRFLRPRCDRVVAAVLARIA